MLSPFKTLLTQLFGPEAHPSAADEAHSLQLATANEAAKQLRSVWVDILQGKTDINSLSILISDVNEFVTAVQALEAADKTN